MAQLKMYRLSSVPFDESKYLPLPEGVSFSTYSGPGDITPWCDCMRDGELIRGENDQEDFDGSITRFHDGVIVPEKDVHFLDYHGEHVGSVTGFIHRGTKIGDMHMVGIRKDFRGRGLAKYLSYICIRSLIDRGAEYISLTTDEFRAPAVKSYFNAGFQPVEYDRGMQGRWEKMLAEHGVDHIQMLTDNAEPYKVIYADPSKVTRAETAMQLFSDGYNCAQSVSLAFADLINVSSAELTRLSSSFGGGMGRLREVCGAVTGMFMIAGLLFGCDGPKGGETKTAHYAEIQELARRFEEKTGSIICRRLLGLDEGASDPKPEPRTEGYYQTRPCKELVGIAAGILDDFIREKRKG